jgi:very-short-patch-repair endonuclease
MQHIWKNARELRNNATDAELKLWRQSAQSAARRREVQEAISHRRPRRRFRFAGTRTGNRTRWRTTVEQRSQDEDRTRKLACNGYRVLRFWNDDVLLRTQNVVAEILCALTQPLPSPPLQSQGRE